MDLVDDYEKRQLLKESKYPKIRRKYSDDSFDYDDTNNRSFIEEDPLDLADKKPINLNFNKKDKFKISKVNRHKLKNFNENKQEKYKNFQGFKIMKVPKIPKAGPRENFSNGNSDKVSNHKKFKENVLEKLNENEICYKINDILDDVFKENKDVSDESFQQIIQGRRRGRKRKDDFYNFFSFGNDFRSNCNNLYEKKLMNRKRGRPKAEKKYFKIEKIRKNKENLNKNPKEFIDGIEILRSFPIGELVENVVNIKIFKDKVHCLIKFEERSDGIQIEDAFIPSDIVTEKYPMKLIDFYESKIVFR